MTGAENNKYFKRRVAAFGFSHLFLNLIPQVRFSSPVAELSKIKELI